MSQPSRPRAQAPSQRRNRNLKLEGLTPLERRDVLAPVVSVYPLAATFTAADTPTNSFLGSVVVDENTDSDDLSTAAPITSVAEMTPLSSFGGDMVKIEAGPGGEFGNGLYAISRGAGGNEDAVNRPGVIYRIDPATGKASVFFDLNTVMSQYSADPLSVDGVNPAATSLGGATNGATDATGFTNWYDIAFDSEGYIDGGPSMLVSMADRNDPTKNTIYRIAPDGTFMGAFVTLTDGQASTKFNINPTAVEVPGPEMQQYLKGVLTGSGVSTTGGTMAALFFNANEYSPGQILSNASSLPKGVSETGMYLGPIAAITQANIDYDSPAYSAFTDFGTPGLPYDTDAGGIPASPGVSGVQGSNGGLLITGPTYEDDDDDTFAPDDFPVVTTPFRRFQDIAFDQYGYFTQSVPLSASDSDTSSSDTLYEVTGQPSYAGNLFVSDLATGLYVQVTSVEEGDIPAGVVVNVPVQGSGVIGIQKADPTQPYDAVTNPLVPIVTNGNTTSGTNVGGRIIRITPDGEVSVFAEGFDTSGVQNSTSFMDSTLSITFSADGTTMYASDGDAIWQFKTTASLAGSTSGTIVGLNDLRTLGVPYDGQGSAVAVIDTGVDALSSPFRGRVGTGKNLYTGGAGNNDLASFTGGGSDSGTTTNNDGGTGSDATSGSVLANTFDGHGTPVAGVVAQFVPQATIEPVAIFSPYVSSSTYGGSSGSSSSSNNNNNNNGSSSSSSSIPSVVSNTLTSTNAVYNGLAYVASNPYVNDPVRPGQVSRVIASTMAFGTVQTWQSEAQAYKNYPQIVIALKLQLKKFRSLGIAPIAAAGQFGSPLGLGSGSSDSSNNGSTDSSSDGTGLVRSNADNAAAGDNNGMSLPAILNEVLSVTGTYPFPYYTDASTTPVNTAVGVVPNPPGPVLVFMNQLTIGGTAETGTGGTTGGGTTTDGEVSANVELFASGDFNIWSDRIPASVNRSITTDFAAPSIDVPTFRRRASALQIAQVGDETAGDADNRLTFNQVGTSMSTGILTGAYAMVSSALDYWTNLDQSDGVTADAYLTTPVGVTSLNFGTHGVGDLSAYNSPDGINGILAWTAVPVYDTNDGSSVATPAVLTSSGDSPAYARVSVSNAIAAIEGTQALNYLISNNILPIIDANSDGLLTAQEIQDFTDTAATKGMAEAGAMARLLGGTATTSLPLSAVNNTVFYENPDQPGALQRRFNFFDYAANGELKGAVSIDALKMLSGTLLPKPDDYVVVDRQRASANGFLLDPTAERNTTALQSKLPRFMWVPKSTVARFRGMNPTRFKINRNEAPGSYLPAYSLFDVTSGETVQRSSTKVVTTQVVNGKTIRLARVLPGSRIQQATETASTTTEESTATQTTATATPAASTETPATTVETATTEATATEQDQANRIIAAVTDLAQQNQNQTTLGTATPLASEAATSAVAEGVATAAATTASSAAVSTETPTAVTTDSSSTTSAESAAAELAAQQQAAAEAQAAKLAAYKKAKAAENNKSTLAKLWDDIKSPFS